MATEDRIAICQHPNGPGEYVPAGHINDGLCFMDCDCTPRVYVAVDSQSSGEARAAYWEDSATEWKTRVAELEAALRDIANKTYDVQYDNVPAAVVRFAGPLHDIARRAIEPPVTKGDVACSATPESENA